MIQMDPRSCATLVAENERLRMQVVACGVVAMADTPASSVEARNMHPDYKSASCDDVARRVDECITLRAEVERLKGDYHHACKLVADMHAAAVGEVTGPKAGVVEDVAAVRAELERLRKDAERYRWLRKQHWSDSDIAVVVNPKKHTRLGAILPSFELLDDTIDHMRKGTP